MHEEFYDLTIPENAGFVIPSVSPIGGTQNLTNRFQQKRIYLNDRRPAGGQGNTAYISINEENPSVNNTISTNSILY